MLYILILSTNEMRSPHGAIFSTKDRRYPLQLLRPTERDICLHNCGIDKIIDIYFVNDKDKM